MTEAWPAVAQRLRVELGIANPERFRRLWERAQNEPRPRLTGLLGFLAERYPDGDR